MVKSIAMSVSATIINLKLNLPFIIRIIQKSALVMLENKQLKCPSPKYPINIKQNTKIIKRSKINIKSNQAYVKNSSQT